MKARIIHRGRDFGDKNRYVATSDTRPTSDEVAETQRKLGFHPHGYGGPDNLVVTEQPDGRFSVTWDSASTCE